MFIFTKENEGTPFWQSVFKEGITFEWIKNKVAEQLEANYGDLTLFLGDKRIIEPFCPVDMGIAGGSQTQVTVKIADGAVLGNDELREQVLAEIAEAEKQEALQQAAASGEEQKKE